MNNLKKNFEQPDENFEQPDENFEQPDEELRTTLTTFSNSISLCRVAELQILIFGQPNKEL